MRALIPLEILECMNSSQLQLPQSHGAPGWDEIVRPEVSADTDIAALCRYQPRGGLHLWPLYVAYAVLVRVHSWFQARRQGMEDVARHVTWRHREDTVSHIEAGRKA